MKTSNINSTDLPNENTSFPNQTSTIRNSKLDSTNILFKNDTLKKNEETKKRYNKKMIMGSFLKSSKGIKFLIDSSDLQLNTNLSIHDKVDNIIDFYTTWSSQFPVRENMTVTKYEFLKEIQEFCKKNNISEELDFVL